MNRVSFSPLKRIMRKFYGLLVENGYLEHAALHKMCGNEDNFPHLRKSTHIMNQPSSRLFLIPYCSLMRLTFALKAFRYHDGVCVP